jgi:predicted ferric reductase
MQDSRQSFNIEDTRPQVSLLAFFMCQLAAIWGVVIGVLLLQSVLPGMTQSILAAQPKVFWFLSRASAFIAYGLLWFSMVMGVGVTNKMAVRWPGLGKTNELHQFVSILGIAFGLFHGLILLGDQYFAFKLAQVLVPFTVTGYRPFVVGLGQTAFYLWAIILGSFYVRKKIGSKAWRFVHYFTYLCYAGVLIHGLLAGTDAGTGAALTMYWVTGGALLFLTIYRVLHEVQERAEKRARMAAIRG